MRIGAAGRCRTELHIIEGAWRSSLDPDGKLLPYIPGHETAGWVEEVGSAVTSVKPGDAVICHPLRTCWGVSGMPSGGGYVLRAGCLSWPER